jgi:hypothetical protein
MSLRIIDTAGRTCKASRLWAEARRFLRMVWGILTNGIVELARRLSLSANGLKRQVVFP